MDCPHCHAPIETLASKFLDQYPPDEQMRLHLEGREPRVQSEACPVCGEQMYIRRHPATKEVYLLTREDALSLDSMRLANLYLRVCDDPFARFVATPRADDVSRRVWSVLDRCRRAAVKRADWNVASKLSLEKARYRCGLGKSFFSFQSDAMRYQLLALQARGATKVRIVAGRDGMVCLRCAEQSGRVLTIEEALEAMPLPVRCDTDGRKGHIDHDHEWCRCVYARQE